MTVTLELSSKEDEAVEELRRRLKSSIKPEVYEDKMLFYRFAKARDFNVDNAETMLKKHFEWRKEWGIEKLLTDYKKIEVVEKYLPTSVLGYDKEGSIVRYVALGRIDSKGMCMSVKVPDFEKHVFYLMEHDLDILEKQSKKLGKRVDKCVYIFDFEELSFAQATDRKCIEVVIAVVLAYQSNYPERLKAAIVINGSMYFSLAYTIIKTFLAGSVLEKIFIFGPDGWKQELLKYIDAEELPAFLGGKKTDPNGDSMCKSFINFGGKIPERYYMHRSKRSLAKLPGVKKVVLSRAAFHEETIGVKDSGSFLEWEFETKTRDIGFGLFLQEVVTGEEKMTELIPIQRIDTDEYAETGMYKCEAAGKYVMIFDNTYSWLRSKEIYFKTAVISPKDQKENNLK